MVENAADISGDLNDCILDFDTDYGAFTKKLLETAKLADGVYNETVKRKVEKFFDEDLREVFVKRLPYHITKNQSDANSLKELLSEEIFEELMFLVDEPKVFAIEERIRGEIEGIYRESFCDLLKDNIDSDFAQLIEGHMFRKTVEYYHANYPALRGYLAKILEGATLAAEEKVELIENAKEIIKPGEYLNNIEEKILALYMKQNVQIHTLIKELSELSLSRVLKIKLEEVNAIYGSIAEIDNVDELAELLGIEPSKIPPLVNEVVKENTTEDSTIKEWLDEQFRKNAEAQKQGAEQQAIESGMTDLVEGDQFAPQTTTEIATASYEPALPPMGDAHHYYDAA